MSALILTRSDVASLLRLTDCISVVEEAFRQHALGTAVPPAVLSLHADAGAFHIKAAGVQSPTPCFAAKINGNFPGNYAHHGLPTIQGVIVLADLTTGSPLAIMDSIEITVQRTGAATAVAAKYLARDDAAVVTIVGCGVQGRIQLRSVASVRRVADVYAYDIDGDASRRFATEMAPVIGAPIVPVSDLPRALAHSDIVVTCTTSRRPLVRPSDVRPGTFIAAVGADNPEKHEIDPELMAASKVVTDVTAQSATIGDLRHAIATGLMQAGEVYAELGEIVTGRKAGRTSDDEVFVFDSTGMALQDVAAAVLVYQHALTKRAGRAVAINSPRAGGSRSRFINVLARARHRI